MSIYEQALQGLIGAIIIVFIVRLFRKNKSTKKSQTSGANKIIFAVTFFIIYLLQFGVAMYFQLQETSTTSGTLVNMASLGGLITSYFITKEIIKKINNTSSPIEAEIKKENDDDPEGLKVVRGAIQVVTAVFVLSFLFALAAQ